MSDNTEESHTVTSTSATDAIEICEKSSDSTKPKDILLPIECLAPSEPSFYDWKEITGEFLDAVKGTIREKYDFFLWNM